MRTFIILASIVFLALQVNAQSKQKLPVKLDWSSETSNIKTSLDVFQQVLHFNGASNYESNNYLPVYSQNVPLSTDGTIEITLENAVYEPLANTSLARGSKLIGNSITIKQSKGYFKKRPVAQVYFTPIITGGPTGFQKLVSADLNVTVYPSANKSANKANNYAANSVLSSGNWYKVAIAENGMYKIDFTLLQELGMNPSSIDPRNLRVYGNGGGMLPEDVNESVHDDLVENPIVVVGEGDGSFDNGDYILFYAQGPDQWRYNTTDARFEHDVHHYTTRNFYFITADKGAGKRIGSQASAVGNPTHTVTTFDDYAWHELEETNLLQSGRDFFGDYFTFSITSRNYNFNFPNLVTSTPVKIRAQSATRALSGGANWTFTANGQQVLNINSGNVSNSYTARYAQVINESSTFTSNSDQVAVNLIFDAPVSNTEGWLDFIELNARRNLTFTGSQTAFRDINSIGNGNLAKFIVQNANAGTKILDVTDPTDAKFQQHTTENGAETFIAATDELKHFVAYSDGGSFLTPEAAGSVANQNLHGDVGQPDMIIITDATLWDETRTLKEHHENTKGLDVAMVNIKDIYNEFSSGAQDISAVRNFVKMLYDRATIDEELPQYLLLMGDASYDYKDITPDNSNSVPTYESANSIDPISTFSTDDFFGLLDDASGTQIMDIAIGRIPARNTGEVRDVVNKIISYESRTGYGSWRNDVTFIGDDEDNNTHLNDAEVHVNFMKNNQPAYNVDKIYLDAFEQESTPGGNRYPDVNEAINTKMFSGTLIMNYVGHGGTNGMALERVVQVNDIRSWENFEKLPLFITATCELSKFDDPAKFSAGEQILFNSNGGAIAMITTVRLVFSGANERLNTKILNELFKLNNGRFPTLGEATMNSKNELLADPNEITNARKFTLLGDPAVTLAYPRYDVVTTKINGVDIATATDTLKALGKVTITGEVRDDNNNVMTDFNGVVFPTIFDKPITLTTLKNDATSQAVNFELQRNTIFKGKASVTNGQFEFSFVVPKDITYNLGEGKISYYATDNVVDRDAHGYKDDVAIGGTADGVVADNQGPEIKVYMNDENFVFGGITDENPILLVKLFDLNGINTAGTGIGHDLTGILNEDTKNTIVLNDFYESDLDSYQSGSARYPLSELEPGRYTVRAKAWDVFNNSSEDNTEFVVANSADIALEHVLNYPNPFTTNTNFQFEHNKPGEELLVQVKIFTVSGKLVKTIKQNVLTDGYRVDGINWDGLDDYGDQIGRGVYVYKLNVSTSAGEKAHRFEKLVILR